VQVRLIGLGLLRGRAGGVMGPQTSSAISQFESGSALPVDSVPLPPLLARLQVMP
jgi:peptidoglycan hydrolase-like protein with peptidoglycan-binding domain